MLCMFAIAWRHIRRAPAMNACAVAIFGVTIGANAAIFGVGDAVLIRPLPYDDPGQVYVLRMAKRLADSRVDSSVVPLEYIRAIVTHHRGIAAVGLRGGQSVGTRVGNQSEWVQSTAVTSGYFQALGVRPVRGRLFNAGDTAEPGRAALLTYDFWQRRFAGDANVIGRAMALGSRTRDVIGVLPPGFVFPAVFVDTPYGAPGRPDYITVIADPFADTDPAAPVAAGGMTSDPVVRLRHGVTREQAQAQINALVAPLMPAVDRLGAPALQLHDLRSLVFPTGQYIMALLMVAAGLVLLIGCANLSIMLVTRERRHEMELGVRVALGATRTQVTLPTLVEVGLIGLAGGTVGLLLAFLAFDPLLHQVPPIAYGSASVGIDRRVVLFTISLGLLAGLVSGGWPAWRATRADVQTLIEGRAWRGAAGSRGLLARPLVTGQVALAIVLVFGATVTAKTFLAVVGLPLGFNPDNVFTAEVQPPRNSGSRTEFYRQAIETISRYPDVISAGAGSSLPLATRGAFNSDEHRLVDIQGVLPGFLETIGATLLRGRITTWNDMREGSSACVVTESAALRLFPGADPIGGRLRDMRGKELTVVGIVADVRKSLDVTDPANIRPLAFALADDRVFRLVVVARVRGHRAATFAGLRNALVKMAPDQPVTAAWWTDSIDALVPLRNSRLQAFLLGGFAALALGLTALALFAVVSFLVVARTRETGVRLALGASPARIIASTLRQALVPVVVGAVLGVVVSEAVRAVVESHLFGVKASNPGLLAGTVLAVLFVAVLAAYLPARGAARVDPVALLRRP